MHVRVRSHARVHAYASTYRDTNEVNPENTVDGSAVKRLFNKNLSDKIARSAMCREMREKRISMRFV